jgi:hypothetical protein
MGTVSNHAGAKKARPAVKNKKKALPSHLTSAADKKRSEKETMPCRITVRLTPEQLRKVEVAASAKGHKPSSYCRLVILGRKVTDLSPETRQFRQALINGGNNLNQLVRHMNQMGASKSDIKEVNLNISRRK